MKRPNTCMNCGNVSDQWEWATVQTPLEQIDVCICEACEVKADNDTDGSNLIDWDKCVDNYYEAEEGYWEDVTW